jgi:two-component system OmpR family sensor kinase
MNSLLGRILLWSLGAVVIGAAASGWWMYRNLLAQTDAFFDRQLRETALALRHQAFEFAVVPELAEPQAGYDIVVQVWTLTGLRVYQSQPRTVLPGITQLGLSTVETEEGRWRVFGVPARGFVIQVAQPMSVRQREAARLALGTLFPFLVLVPVLVALISIAVTHGMRPLRRVAERVRTRPATALDPIPESPLPGKSVRSPRR